MRVYDNAPANYHDELASWFPSWYQQVLEMDALWQTWGALLDQLQADIMRVLNNNFLVSCDEDTIHMWEDFLNITIVKPRDLENRRRFIMMHFGGFGKCSATKIKSVIKQYTGSDSTVTFERYDAEGNHWLNIQMERGDMETLYVGDVQFVLDKIIPAHILHSLKTVQEANIRSSVSISRYRYTYSPTGVRPETATLGAALGLVETYKTEQSEFIHEYPQTNQSSVAGVHPETATLGRGLELTEASQTGVSIYPVEYSPASDNTASGTLPGSLEL